MAPEIPNPIDVIGDAIDCGADPMGCLGDGVKKIGGAVADGAVGAFAQAIGKAVEEILKSLNGVWLTAGGNTDLNPHEAVGTKAIATETGWIVGYIAVACVLLAAFRMAYERKGQSMQQAFMGMWKVILVSAMAPAVAQGLYKASDTYAKDIYAKADLGKTAEQLTGAIAMTSPGIIIIFGILIMLSSFIQIILMYIRLGVLVMLIGTLPIAAASSMTGWGEGWWKKHIGWTTAWLLYKPAAALIIYSAASMTKGKANLDSVIAGMGLLILSVFALPALLKLVVPATAALGSTSGGTVAMNMATSIASGAISIAGGAAGGGGGGAGGGGGGGKGPEGSPSAGAGSSASGAGGGAAAGGAAAAAAGPAAIAVQAAAVVAQAGIDAAKEIAGSLDDNDGMKGHNQ
ncbi:hypothetical protein AB0P15_20255 [Streptomyces sp. NPDC087917]|uniref:hypothetical protein n=1 Tax=Streptomyces sp. NPDC087917 TaxID=3155060 RepID=UPI0034237BFB